MKLGIFAKQSGEAGQLTRERKTVTAMLRIYCRDQHGGGRELCERCLQLHAYAMRRLDRCPYGGDKPACVDCPIHCYRAERRREIRAVMRYAGPRMLWRHPWLALRHMLGGRRPTPPSPHDNQPAATDTKSM
jgi:hypothetical protein